MRSKWKVASLVLLGAGLILVVAGNGHLVYVAVKSQPGCVDHLRAGDAKTTQTQFSAAKSSCSP
jgi:hypothetical protein